MGMVTVDRAQVGMVLTAPVIDRKGRMLIPAEVALTDRHLQALKMWASPRSRCSRKTGTPQELSVDPEVEASIRAALDERFRDPTAATL